jgi:hypothetical protein
MDSTTFFSVLLILALLVALLVRQEVESRRLVALLVRQEVESQRLVALLVRQEVESRRAEGQFAELRDEVRYDIPPARRATIEGSILAVLRGAGEAEAGRPHSRAQSPQRVGPAAR